jgi:Nuclease-related domain
MNEKKSPLKTKPRRAAGQSVQQELERLEETFMGKGLLAVLTVVLLSLEFMRWYWKMQPSPIGASIVCVPLFIYSVYKMLGMRGDIKNLRQGLDGEKIVGEKLENLRAHGYRVFHDLVSGSFNVDHILIGPAGVFAIETKTWSKSKGDKIEHNGETLCKNSVEIKPNPIEQVKAEARWLRGLIKELTDINVFVQPVVVFPGWWVECRIANPQVLVLNPDQLEGILKTLPIKLEDKDIGFISKRLELLTRGASLSPPEAKLEVFYDPAKVW